MNCKDCKFWEVKDEHKNCILEKQCNDYDITHPCDGDYNPIDIGFSLGQCKNPKITFYETPISNDGATVCDGSHYHAELITAEMFGCALFESKPPRKGK